MSRKTKHISGLTRDEILAFVPRFRPGARYVELDSGEALVSYEKGGSRPVRWLRRLLVLPETTEIMFDAMGAQMIRQMEGRRTLGAMIEHVSAELGVGCDEAEATVLRFLDALCRHKLVSFERSSLDREPNS